MTRGCLNIALSERIPKTYCRNDVSDGDSCPSRSGIARHPFNARRPNISASLGFNMWKGSRAHRRLIASYFRPAGKTGKLTAQYIAGMKAREKERERGSPANKWARKQGQLAALTLLIVATDENRHCIGDESFFPVLPGEGGKKKKRKILSSPSSPVPPICFASVRVCPTGSLLALHHHQRHVLTWE